MKFSPVAVLDWNDELLRAQVGRRVSQWTKLILISILMDLEMDVNNAATLEPMMIPSSIPSKD